MGREGANSLPTWLLIVSVIFASLEIMVSFLLWFSPGLVVESLDLSASGVDYVLKMWAVRQFSLGIIIAYATWSKSAPMLKISYIFLLVMFVGDFIIGILQRNISLIITALVMCLISSALISVLSKKSLKSVSD